MKAWIEFWFKHSKRTNTILIIIGILALGGFWVAVQICY